MIEEESSDRSARLALVEERLTVAKQEVETGRVQVATKLEQRQEHICEPLLHEDVIVERVKVGRIVDAAPASRQEGDTLIIPVMEEVLVVEKRLVLKEEIHVIRTSRVELFEQDVTLRAMHADVQRTTTAPQK